jgi:nitroreductase
MSGIVFHGTKQLERIEEFYTETIGMQVWLRQADCIILKHGNLLLGFCSRDRVDKDAMLTFFYDTKQEVDEMYSVVRESATDTPRENEKYNIYQFFARDPEERALEFQAFLSPMDPFEVGDDLLVSRRSIRSFKDTDVTDELLTKVFELCRYSPTSRNCQSFYYQVIRDHKTLGFLAGLRGSSSAPIAEAPLAVAVCVDTERTKRVREDGCIAAYHFLLAAKLHGLGTCWIAAMDREDAKDALGVPQHHHVATITPVGYPVEWPGVPKRREVGEFVHFGR